ncbi:MAG TPA: glycoside hydrolase domain-containing protein [Candidatus Elarobacter sp.]|nr:glycoside hydrolase domain-containing protein [Candidatus Elarobacter sp.]
MPTLPGVVRAASPGARGFDASDTLSDATIAAAVSKGFTFCLRYLRFEDHLRPGDLDNDEAARIVNAGLALMAIFPYPGDGWSPDEATGTLYGTRSANAALEIGFPSGVNIWIDVEGVNAASSAQDVIAFVNAWSAAVSEPGYVPGIYVGANAGLDGNQLYYDLTLQHYWQSGSIVPAVAVRGYQMIQTIRRPTPVIGTNPVDFDTTQTDHSGGNAQWLTLH